MTKEPPKSTQASPAPKRKKRRKKAKKTKKTTRQGAAPPLLRKQESETEAPEGYVSLGYVTQAHGLQGELRIHLHNPQGDSLYLMEQLWLRRPGEAMPTPFAVEKIRPHTKGPLVSFADVTSRDDAEALKKAEVFLSEADLPALEEGEFYLFQLEGLDAYSTEGELLGPIVHVMTNTAQPLLVILHEGVERFVPLVDAIVPSVDVAARRVEIALIPGLLD